MKRLFLIFFSLTTTLLTAGFSFFLAETFFFDKLIYKKSPFHGYTKNVWVVTNQKNNFLIEWRIRNLRTLINDNNQEEKVLGAQTEKDVYKIALIGDSFAYGLGVRENESFGRVLEKKLNGVKPTKIYILALPGDSIVENYTKFLLAEKKIKPNLYVYSMLDNDTLYDYGKKYPNETEVYQLLRDACPGKEFLPTWKTTDWEDRLINEIIPSYSLEFINRCWLETVVKYMVQKNDKILFYPLDAPIKGNLTPIEEFSNKILTEYRTIVKNAGGIIIESDPAENSFYHKISRQETHPNSTTHRFYAENLFQEIISDPRWGFYYHP